MMLYIMYILYNAPLSGGEPGPVDQVPLVQVQHAARRSLSQHHAGWRHWYDQLPGTVANWQVFLYDKLTIGQMADFLYDQ